MSVLPMLSVDDLFLVAAARAPPPWPARRAWPTASPPGQPPADALLLPDKCGWVWRMSLKALGFRVWKRRWYVLKGSFCREPEERREGGRACPGAR